MQRHNAALVVVVFAIAACRSASPGGGDSESQPSPNPATAQPNDANDAKVPAVNLGGPIALAGTDSLFLSHVAKAEAVFIGKLTDAGEPPGFFSGYRAATQALTYEVERVLRGEVDQPTMLVHQLIVAMSPVLEGDTPVLQARYTQVGSRYIVAVGGTSEGKRVMYNENMAPLDATPENVAKVEKALGL
jgi:hypothetical protein